MMMSIPIPMCSNLIKLVLIVLAAVPAVPGRLLAQPLSCNEVHAIAKMANAQSSKALKRLQPAAGNSYRARLVFTFRRFEVEPTITTAPAVLDLLPQNESHSEDWQSLSGWICDQEKDKDVKSLAKLQTRMSRDFAKAVILRPEKMFQYVSYPVILGLAPHDDFAEQMVRVCRQQHSRFVAAVNQLPERDRAWFLRTVFEPSGCRALAHPEAD
jgi:hypothetical protein